MTLIPDPYTMPGGRVIGMHALIIEDQYLIAALIEDELGDLGYTTFDIVERESDAIAGAAARRPDLITADDHLTEGTGIGAVQAICANQAIPVVFILGSGMMTELPVPFSAVIGKPIAGTSLVDAVGESAGLARDHEGRWPMGDALSVPK